MKSSINHIENRINEPSKIHFSDNTICVSTCLNCKNKDCIHYMDKELENDDVKIPINIDNNVCPVSAISIENNEVVIDNDKCIKCGLCISRCKTGCIYLQDGEIKVNKEGKISLKESDFDNVPKTGSYIIETDELLNEIYYSINKCNINPNIFARNLLLQCGVSTLLSRKGDVNLRMDGIFVNNNKYGVCEIEFNNDVLSCPRCLLDDLSVLCSRYNYNLEDMLALVISLNLPNNRTDFWRVINDISNILDIKIQTISIGALLLIMWNNKKIDLNEVPFYCDFKNNSLRGKIEVIIDRKVNLVEDENSILETKK